ncbi:XRE family transcriptional regulator [Streptomyces sp. NPDC046805]|uniref:XRE family transcriptional regulator n=1 Tax=Streptomyces sp. NPDC046805 TaxID=3155134 RepID=UPI0033CA16FC
MMRQLHEQATPDEPLLVRLRELRDRTGLSLVALAARTPYSKSAWHRYLSGTQRPPRSAVEALARLADADPFPVLSLWEAADAPPIARPPDETDQVRPRGARLRSRLPLPMLALLTLAAAAIAAFAMSGRHSPHGAQNVVAAPRCHGRSCQGMLPDASACARDARTKSTVTGPAYVVRLRHSPSCGTVWAEVLVRSGHAREVSVRAGQDVLSATYPARNSTGYASPMLAVSSPRGAEACAEVDEELACTGLNVEEFADARAPRSGERASQSA